MRCDPRTDDRRATDVTLDELPELRPGESLLFACHPGVSCFNACCADLDLVLAPYDVLRLRAALDVDSSTFDATHADIERLPDSGFPCRRLRMRDGAAARCPFVGEAGCAVYADRPAACRTYPLGRAARIGADGTVAARLIVVREPHCRGFDEARTWTGSAWLGDQGLEPYNVSSDRYLELIARVGAAHGVLSAKQARLADLALYQVDRFQAFLDDVELLERLAIAAPLRAAIIADPATCLSFALDWLEMVLLRDRERLADWR